MKRMVVALAAAGVVCFGTYADSDACWRGMAKNLAADRIAVPSRPEKGTVGEMAYYLVAGLAERCAGTVCTNCVERDGFFRRDYADGI